MSPEIVDALAGYVGSNMSHGGEALTDHRLDEAVHALEVATALDPSDLTSKNLLAIAHFRSGNYELSALLFEDLVLSAPDRPTHRLNLALAHLRSSDLDKARAVFDDLVDRWPELVVSSGLDRAMSEVEASVRSAQAVSSDAGGQAPFRAVTAVPPGAVPEPYNMPPEASRGKAKRPASVPPSFVASVARIQIGQPGAAPSGHTMIPPDLLAPPAPLLVPATGEVGTLLDAALAALVVVPQMGVTSSHGSGIVFVPLVDAPGADPETSGLAVRATGLHALAGDVSTRAFSVPSNDDKPFLRDHAESFVHAFGRGHAIVAPRAERHLLPLRMSGDATFVREDYVAAYDRRLNCAIGSFRLSSKRSMTMVRLIGEGVLVLDLPRNFIAFDVTEAGTLTLRDDTLLGWVGRIVTEPLATALPVSAGAGMLRLAGEGTVLVIPPKRPDPPPAQEA